MIKKINEKEENFEDILKKIAKLEQEVFPKAAYSYQGLVEMLKSSKQFHIYYIERGKSLLAYLLVLDSIDCFEILKIAVRNEMQRQGLGKKLLKEISRRDIFLEVRETNRKAIIFYENYGFQEIARRKEYYPDTREDAVIMKMEVNYGS